jgi:glycine dehydrogenase subunit 1
MIALEGSVDENTAAVVVQSPNFLGALECWPAVAEIAHRHGALLVAVISEPLSLALVKPPAEADIVCGEAQSFGVPVAFGGPYVGFLATREQLIRQMPGRLVGETRDADGHRGYVLTLATREQHIRREKATSNICTSQSLMALNATIYLCLLGKSGLRQLAAQNLAKAQYAEAELGKVPGASLPFSAPHFNEFVVKVPGDAEDLLAALREEKIIGGLHLDRFYPELKDHLLICVTEVVPKSALDRTIEVWHRFSQPTTNGEVAGAMVGYNR